MRTFLILVLLAAMGVGGWLAWALGTPVTPPGQKFVLLHAGYSTRRIATELKSAGVIRSVDAFVLWHYFHRKRSLKAGEYLFERAANAIEIHNRLARGDIYVHMVVVPEGYTLFGIARGLPENHADRHGSDRRSGAPGQEPGRISVPQYVRVHAHPEFRGNDCDYGEAIPPGRA